MHGDIVRKYQCECLSTFYIPDGIEPEFCPSCGGKCGEVRIMKYGDDEGLGAYREDEAE